MKQVACFLKGHKIVARTVRLLKSRSICAGHNKTKCPSVLDITVSDETIPEILAPLVKVTWVYYIEREVGNLYTKKLLI